MYSVTSLNQFLKGIVVLHLLVFLICVGLLFHSRGLFAYLVFTIREIQILRRGRARARFSQYYAVRAREPTLFWGGNVIAIVIVVRVLARMSCIIQRSGEGFNSFNENKLSKLCGEQKYNEAFRVSIFREQARKINIKCQL